MISQVLFLFYFSLFTLIRKIVCVFGSKKDYKLVLFSYTRTCQRTLAKLRLDHQNAYTLEPTLNSLLGLIKISLTQPIVYIFVLNHWKYFKQHRLGCLISFIAGIDGYTATLQHAAYKLDSLEGLASTKTDLILTWSIREKKWLKAQGKKAFVLGRIDLTAPPKNLEQKSASPLLIATCTHDEYKADEEHARYLTGLFKIIAELNLSAHVRPHPGEKHRHEFYKTQIAPFRKNITFIEELLHPLNYSVLITRASSLADDFNYWKRPVIIADLSKQGPSICYSAVQFNAFYTYEPFEKDVFQSALTQYNQAPGLNSIIHEFDRDMKKIKRRSLRFFDFILHNRK